MANNKIKGLTVEIGGDTTKLGKALDNVEKKSRDLSSELGEINKLLKFDPGNADLLAQKQKVLADAIANTGKKLDTLKEAEKQVQEQFARGEVSEEQVRALQREIMATEKKMASYEKAARETAEAVEKLGDGSDEAGDELQDTKKNADKAADSLDDLADSADEAGEAGEGLGSKLGNAAKTGLTAIAGAATAVVGAMVGCAEATREYRTEMAKIDAAFAEAAVPTEKAKEAYTELYGVLGDEGQAVEAVNHLAKLVNSEEELTRWTEIATGVYGAFGASLPIEGLTEAANETAKVGQVTGAVADALNWTTMHSFGWEIALGSNTKALAAFNKATKEGASAEDAFNAALATCNTEQERAALITSTLGAMYEDTAAEFRYYNEDVINANKANEAWNASMAEVGALVEPLITDVKMLGASFLSDLLPGVSGVTEALRGILGGEEGAADALGESLSGLLTSLLNKVVEMAPDVANTALSLITSLATSLLSMVPQILSTGFEIVMALVEGLTSAIPQIITQGAQILTSLGEGIGQNMPSLVSRALDALMKFATTLYDNAPTLIQAGLDLLGNLVKGIVESLPILIAKGPEIISKLASVINDNFPTILRKGVQLLGQLGLGIIQAIPTLVANIPKIITAIVDVWEAFNWVNLGKRAIIFLKDGVLKMVGAVKSAGTSVMNGVTNAIKSLPDKLFSLGKNSMSKIVTAIKNAVGSVKSGATSVLNGVVNTFKTLPSKMLNIGKDLVRGLANGISDMAGWVLNKIKGFSDKILSGIKSFFGVNSPSKETAWIGQMLDEGLVKGVEDYADRPLKAMADLSQGMLDEADELNGVTLNRQLSTTFSADPVLSAAETGIMTALDSILEAVKNGHILAIDGEALVGATLSTLDAKLGRKRLLAARGAL